MRGSVNRCEVKLVGFHGIARVAGRFGGKLRGQRSGTGETISAVRTTATKIMPTTGPGIGRCRVTADEFESEEGQDGARHRAPYCPASSSFGGGPSSRPESTAASKPSADQSRSDQPRAIIATNRS